MHRQGWSGADDKSLRVHEERCKTSSRSYEKLTGMNHTSLLRATRTQTIRDQADDPSATDVDLAAEAGRLQLEINLALANAQVDSDALRALTRARLQCVHVLEVLALGRIVNARNAIESIRETLATFGNRPTEPPSVRHGLPDNAAAASHA